MLRTCRARHDRFALNAPFRISRGVKTAADVVTVTVEGGGHVGRGEGVPYPRYGETIDDALAQIAAAAAIASGVSIAMVIAEATGAAGAMPASAVTVLSAARASQSHSAVAHDSRSPTPERLRRGGAACSSAKSTSSAAGRESPTYTTLSFELSSLRASRTPAATV